MLIVAESVLLLHLFDKLIWQISAVSTADGAHDGTHHNLSVSKTTTSYIYPYSAYKKIIIIERTMQHIKDRSTEECFDGYFLPFKRKEKCKLNMIKWLKLFMDFHNKEWNVK